MLISTVPIIKPKYFPQDRVTPSTISEDMKKSGTLYFLIYNIETIRAQYIFLDNKLFTFKPNSFSSIKTPVLNIPYQIDIYINCPS